TCFTQQRGHHLFFSVMYPDEQAGLYKMAADKRRHVYCRGYFLIQGKNVLETEAGMFFQKRNPFFQRTVCKGCPFWFQKRKPLSFGCAQQLCQSHPFAPGHICSGITQSEEMIRE